MDVRWRHWVFTDYPWRQTTAFTEFYWVSFPMCWTLLTYNVFFCGGFTRYERGNWRLICSGLERIVFVASRDLGNGRLPPVGTDVERVFLWLFFLATSRRTPAITAVLTEPIKVGRLRCPLVDGDAVDDVGRRDAIASLSFSLSLSPSSSFPSASWSAGMAESVAGGSRRTDRTDRNKREM